MARRPRASIYDRLAQSHPAIAAGLVKCQKCHRTEEVDAAECLATGWPICCGETMALTNLNAVDRGPTGRGRSSR